MVVNLTQEYNYSEWLQKVTLRQGSLCPTFGKSVGREGLNYSKEHLSVARL